MQKTPSDWHQFPDLRNMLRWARHRPKFGIGWCAEDDRGTHSRYIIVVPPVDEPYHNYLRQAAYKMWADAKNARELCPSLRNLFLFAFDGKPLTYKKLFGKERTSCSTENARTSPPSRRARASADGTARL